MEYKFVIPGRLPGANEYIDACRGNKYDAALMKRDMELLCVLSMAEGRRKKIHFDAVNVDIVWYEQNAKRDPDNVSFGKKFIFDALQSAKILDNDGPKQIRTISEKFEVDRKNPRIEVTLREHEEQQTSGSA